MYIDSKPKILVVEDEVLVAADLEDRLNGLGYSVCGHSDNYAQALEQIDLYRPDLVILDICLQGDRDGIQVAGELRRRGRTPFIFLTACADPPTLMRASRTRPSGYVLKPLRTRDLDAAIQMALLQVRATPWSSELCGRKVLLLESDPALSRLLSRALVREGASVSMEADERTHFDLVVGGDGRAQGQVSLTLTDFDHGGANTLSKPFKLETFLAKVKELLGA